jgi:hypothetical protein
LPGGFDAKLLSALHRLGLHSAEILVRERDSFLLAYRDNIRAALQLQREVVAVAVRRGGFELAFAITSYGRLLLEAGWVGDGIEYLTVAARMTHRWPPGRMRDLILLMLAGGHAIRGETDAAGAIMAAVPAQASPDSTRLLSARAFQAEWTSRLLTTRGFEQLAADDAPGAVGTFRAAMAAAQGAANRQLLVAVNNNLAVALIEASDFADAAARLAAADALVTPTSAIRAHLLGTRAELALAQGDIGTARELLDQSAAIKAQVGNEGGVGWTLATRSRLEAAAGNQEIAKRLLLEAAGSLQDRGALRAWRLAAIAVGEPDARAELTRPQIDPLLDAARSMSQEVPNRAWEIHRLVVLGLAFALVLPLFWFGFRVYRGIVGGSP